MVKGKSRYPKVRGRTYICDLIEHLSADDWDMVIKVLKENASNSYWETEALEALGITELHRIDVSANNSGWCHYSPPRIDLHTYIMNTEGQEAECRDTLFHEIAHMIAKHACGHQGHGKIWKKVFADLGYPNGTRCHSMGRLQGTTGKTRSRTVYVYGCLGCGNQHERRRRMSDPALLSSCYANFHSVNRNASWRV